VAHGWLCGGAAVGSELMAPLPVVGNYFSVGDFAVFGGDPG
jgi:hypothetical protein